MTSIPDDTSVRVTGEVAFATPVSFPRGGGLHKYIIKVAGTKIVRGEEKPNNLSVIAKLFYETKEPPLVPLGSIVGIMGFLVANRYQKDGEWVNHGLEVNILHLETYPDRESSPCTVYPTPAQKE